jgi:hypothetical protein
MTGPVRHRQGERVSYLSLANGIPDFSKAVISLWFRAPQKSVDAASQHIVGAFPILQQVLPLVTFGRPQKNKNYVANPPINVAIDKGLGDAIHEEIRPYMSSTGFSSIEPYDVDPCYVGLQCLGEQTLNRFRLIFNIQTATEMAPATSTFVTTGVEYYNPNLPPPYTGPLGQNGWIDYYTHTIIDDASYVNNDQPQWFLVQSAETFKPDVWHHLLLSFDIGGEVSIGHPNASSACKLWYAIDDKDYRGSDNLQPYRDTDDGLGLNTILTEKVYHLSGPTPAGGFKYMAHVVPPPSGALTGASVPAEDDPFGIPAPVKYVDAIFEVELAEFQMWTGITLDTGEEQNRRAFVDKDGFPVPPSAAEALLGKRPDILLHGSSKWIDGMNTGSLGVDGSGNTIASGQFTSTGMIDRYKPDPSLAPPAVRLARNAGL